MDLSIKDDTPSNTYLEQDRWDSDRVNIKSEYGVTEGYIKPDSWEPDRLNIYDWYGRPTGTYLKKDPWQPERWNIKKGTIINKYSINP
jgi:hypothetical protein